MSTIPSMLEIISYYLYGKIEKPTNLLNDNITNNVNTPITVNALEFMTLGAGRYIDVGNFKAVRKFLAGDYADKFEIGHTYKTREFWEKLGFKDAEGYPQGQGTRVGISNYGLDT